MTTRAVTTRAVTTRAVTTRAVGDPPVPRGQVHGLLGMLGGSWAALPATTAVLAAGPGTEAEARALGLRAECVGEAAGSADRFAAALAGHCAGRRGVRVFTEF